jgi:glycosyltransferase involved in cell wall biosynthesis
VRLTLLYRYSRLGASSRLRLMQYVPALEDAGFTITAASLFDDEYLQALYSGRRVDTRALRSLLTRFGQCRSYRDADMIWLEKEMFPWLPWCFERFSLPMHIPVVSDYDDAIFHNYDLHSSAFVRHVLGNKIDRVMSNSVLVTAGNRYLAERAERAGARRVEVVPTVVDTAVYQPNLVRTTSERVRIGWIGTPQTWTKYGTPRMAFFREMASKQNVAFYLVGARLERSSEGFLEFVPWSEVGEVSAIHDMDIGIMPLDDSPWERGKCGYKLIQYMACGLPVVASAVGVNVDIVTHGVNGFLVTNEVEWRDAIAALVQDPNLRKRMGEAGRSRVLESYSIQAQGPRVAKLLVNSVMAFAPSRQIR